MSWIKVNISRGRFRGVSLRISDKNVSPRLVVRIGRPTAEAAGFPREKSVRVEVFTGCGEDAGWMKVKPDATGTLTCHGKTVNEALRVSIVAPAGAPAQLASTSVQPVVEDGAVTFPLPWHKRAADREVEELPYLKTWKVDSEQYDVFTKALDNPPPADENLKRLMARKPPWEAKESPPTLDAIEEDARPSGADEHDALVASGCPAPSELDKPVNGAASAKLIFSHNGHKAELPSERHHVLAMRLYKAMGKGILDYNVLMKVIQTKELNVLRSMVKELHKPVGQLRLAIGEQKKMGYFMHEAGG